MKPENILQADVLDIIFENRNKEYGAYQIRKQYSVQLIKGLSIALGGIFFLVFLISFKSDKDEISINGEKKGDVVLTEVDIPKPPVPDQPPPLVPPAPVATVQHVIPVIVPENVPADNPVATVEELTDDIISDHTQPGEKDKGISNQLPEQPSGNGTILTETPVSDEPYHQGVVEEPAEFPGGMKALVRFLERNLHDPRGSDIEEGAANVKVQMQFVINKKGEVERFNAIHSGGERFNEEVIRVLKKMPRWKPARQHKQAVAMYYILPVTFAVN
jgi:periplasmic protein TonB